MLKRTIGRGAALALPALVAIAGCHRGGAVEDRAEAAGPPKAGAALPSLGPTSDPMVALQRMVGVYKGLTSLYMESEADLLIKPGSNVPAHQYMTIKYRRNPAGIWMMVRDPLAGTRQVYADGTNLVRHDGMKNTFMRRDVRGDLAELASAVDKSATQVLTPIVFLSCGSMPPGVQSSHMAGSAVVDGHQTYRVTGELTGAYTKSLGMRLGFGAGCTATRTTYTLWVDQDTYALRKSELHLGWNSVLKNQAGKPVLVHPTIDVTQKIRETVPNPQFGAEEFRFVAPSGAKEVFPAAPAEVEAR